MKNGFIYSLLMEYLLRQKKYIRILPVLFILFTSIGFIFMNFIPDKIKGIILAMYLWIPSGIMFIIWLIIYINYKIEIKEINNFNLSNVKLFSNNNDIKETINNIDSKFNNNKLISEIEFKSINYYAKFYFLDDCIVVREDKKINIINTNQIKKIEVKTINEKLDSITNNIKFIFDNENYILKYNKRNKHLVVDMLNLIKNNYNIEIEDILL